MRNFSSARPSCNRTQPSPSRVDRLHAKALEGADPIPASSQARLRVTYPANMCRFRWSTLATSEPGFRRTGIPKNARAELHACTLETRRLLPNVCAFLVGLAGLGVLARTECFPDLPSSPCQGPVTEPSEKESLLLPSPAFWRLAGFR